jgi:ABC-2 type transport system permease protein
VIFLLLFGALFERVTQLPGFGTTDYIEFLTPGIVVQTALFSASWSGMGVVEDLDRGVMDRFLVSPVRRSSLITGRLDQQAIIAIVQSVIIIGLGLLRGASFEGGTLGLVWMMAVSVLLASPFVALSSAAAVTMRKEESVIGAVQFVTLPLLFTSSVFMAPELMPEWIQTVARFNPANWGVIAAREVALHASPDWSLVLSQVVKLRVFTVLAVLLATRAFRSYQRSV